MIASVATDDSISMHKAETGFFLFLWINVNTR